MPPHVFLRVSPLLTWQLPQPLGGILVLRKELDLPWS